MTVYKKTIELKTKAKIVTYVDVTPQIREAIEESGIENGICAVVTPHTTCAIFFEEYAHDRNEDGLDTLQQDLNNVLSKIIPAHDSAEVYNYPGEEHYQVVEGWDNAAEYLPGGDRRALWNGDAHLKSTLIGTSEVLSVEENQLAIGSTGYVYFADFDVTRDRVRKCSITIIGE